MASLRTVNKPEGEREEKEELYQISPQTKIPRGELLLRKILLRIKCFIIETSMKTSLKQSLTTRTMSENLTLANEIDLQYILLIIYVLKYRIHYGYNNSHYFIILYLIVIGIIHYLSAWYYNNLELNIYCFFL